MPDKIGIINEVGDLGLGWDPLKEKEQEVIEEEYKTHNEKKQKQKQKQK